MPRPGISQDHLRPGMHDGGQSRPPAHSRPLSKALPGAARVRARNRSDGALRAQGTAAARPRMRLRRARPGKRASRSATLTLVGEFGMTHEVFAPLVGQVANGCWLGVGSVFFLQFGALRPPERPGHHPRGELALFADEISWRLEQGEQVLAGSADDKLTMNSAIER